MTNEQALNKLDETFIGDLELKMVLSKALEKQIAKKVKYLNRHGDGYDLYNVDYFHCPSCGRRLRNKQKDPHCGRCGQAIDWRCYR
jgi:hypothetical protein